MSDHTPRPDGRADDELRPVTITRGWLDHAEGSVLVEFGKTRVLCAASVTEGVPRWRKGSGLGWVTGGVRDAAARDPHPHRPRVGQGPDRRPHPRDLAGWSAARCAPSSTYKALGENTIVLDCDVLQADGGTRTAAITGAYVALADAVSWLRSKDARRRAAGDVGRGGQRRHRRRRAAARPLLRRGRHRRDRHERRAAPATAASSRCRARPRARRSTAPSSTALLDLAVAGCADLAAAAAGGARAA